MAKSKKSTTKSKSESKSDTLKEKTRKYAVSVGDTKVSVKATSAKEAAAKVKEK